MSEKVYNEEEWPFEKELIGFNGESLSELDEHLTTFELTTEKFIDTFTSAMEGTAGYHFFDDATTLSHAARIEHVKALEEISEYICDSMDQDTAVRVWATIVHDNLLNINGAMIFLNEKAGFCVPSIQDLQSDGLIYFEGLMKALEDGDELYRTSETLHKNKEKATYDAIAVQDLPELLETEFDTEDYEDHEELRDEYGQWVITEYCDRLGASLNNLVELCQKNKYPPSIND